MRKKTLGMKPMLLNICGLSEGDKAYCGPYGTVTCTKAAKNSKSGKRLFKVEGSLRLENKAGWTMEKLREAICGKRVA